MISTVLINVCAFAIAIVLTRGIKGTNIFRTVYFMPNLIGGILLGYIWQILLNGCLLYTSHVVCTLGLITLRPLSPKGGATKWQSTKPC